MNTTCQSLGTLSCIIDMHAPSYYSLFYNGKMDHVPLSFLWNCASKGNNEDRYHLMPLSKKKAVTMVKAPDFENVLSAGSSDPLGAPTVTQLNPAAHLG